MAQQPNTKPNNNNNNQRRDNFFHKELQRYRGSAPINFMANKDAKQRMRDCKSICKDLIRGNINIAEQSGYFLQPELLDELCNFTFSKRYYYSFLLEAAQEKRNRIISTMGYNFVDNNIIAIINNLDQCAKIYDILFNCFMSIKASGDAAGWLNVIVSQLSTYRSVNI